MLEELRIQDFAIVESLHLRLQDGLNVLTGETGAGKSIVVDALGFVLGDRAGPSLVRSGAKLARVEASFRAAILPDELEKQGIAADDGLLILSREVTAAGRSTCRVNGTLVTLACLRALGGELVEVHGQHEPQGLLSPARHLDYLDRLGGDALLIPRAGLRERWESWRRLRQERDELREKSRERERAREWRAFEAEEIAGARLVADPDEIEALQAERHVLANADKIRVRVEEALSLIDDGEGQGAARSLLARAARGAGQLAGMDPAAGELAAAADAVVVAVDELRRDLAAYGEGIEADPCRLEQVQERLETIGRLQKKYGATVADILGYERRARDELAALEGSAEREAELDADIAALEGELAAAAAELSAARREAARGLEGRVAAELQELEMRGTRFEVRLGWEAAADGLALNADGARYHVGSSGADRVEFLISPNPGEPLMALAQIASGGEMSRVMLAIQTVLAEVDPVGTMVFDEVDAGLGGVAAEAVAARLRRIAQARQVLCVTHLPLVAAAAGTHWSLSKEVQDGRTRTRAQQLDRDARAREIARMLAGKQASETTLRQAEELLGRRKRKAAVGTIDTSN